MNFLTKAGILILLSFSMATFANEKGPKDVKVAKEKGQKNVKIDKEKIKQIREIKKKFKKDSEGFKTEMKALKEKLDKGLVGDMKPAELLSIFKELQSKRNVQQEKRFNTILQARELLPVGQRKYLQKMQRGMHKGMGKRNGKHQGRKQRHQEMGH